MPARWTPKSQWEHWTSPTVDGDLGRRREAVLLETLATLVVIGVVAQVVQISGQLGQPPSPHIWLWGPVLTLTTLGFYGLLRLARAGHHRASATWLIVLISALSFGLLADDGVNQSVWPLLSATAVLLAAFLLGQRPGAAVMGLHSVAVVLASAVEVVGPDAWFSDPKTTGPSAAAGPILLLLLISRTCWLYTREIVTGIDEVLSHGAETSPLRQLRTKSLSVREIEVVQLVAEGLTNDGIGSRLFVSSRTAQSHVANAMGKTGAANRTELGVLAVREGLVPMAVPEEEDELTTEPAPAR